MDLQKRIKSNLKYYKRVQAELDVHHTKAKLNYLRNEHLEKQKNNNYQNEYDRVRSILNNSMTAHHTPLHERKKKLEALGAHIADHIK